jgi:hypothetical protein
MTAMFDHAYKQQPTNEELGAQTFFANVRTGQWKVAQQVIPLSVSCSASLTSGFFDIF